MSGRPQERDQAVQQPPRTPYDFAQGSHRYTRQMRRRRNRRHRLVAALLILAVGIGMVVVLVANWLAGKV